MSFSQILRISSRFDLIDYNRMFPRSAAGTTRVPSIYKVLVYKWSAYIKCISDLAHELESHPIPGREVQFQRRVDS